MNNNQEIVNYYQLVCETQDHKASILKKKIFNIGTARLVVFLATIGLIYLCWGQTSNVLLSILGGIAFFLALLVYHNKLFHKKDYYETQVKLAANELRGLEHDYSPFDGGKEFINPEHSFSYDLDLFGEKSLFQSINRTVSEQGKNKLAEIFQHPLDSKSKIIERQNAIKELAKKHKLMLHFRTLGLVGASKKENSEKRSHTEIPKLKNFRFWKLLAGIIPAGYLVLFLLWLLNCVDGVIFLPLWFITMFISALSSKIVKRLTDYFEKGNLIPSAYSDLFEVIENEEFESELLIQIRNSVVKPEKASISLKKLKNLRNNLDLAFTFPTLMILNPYLMWNIRYSVLIYQWLKANGNNLKIWQQAVADFDALVSLAIYSFNHASFIFPQPEDEFIFEGVALGHPLIKESVSVKNNADIPHKGYFLVVTGANMAGKSTYLRTVGVSHVLACTGSAVNAQSLRFHPGHLVTNLRTTDSLNDNESYFFAELKRLKMIIDRLKSGEKLFIILDEILKGTNSEDKRKGSMALMRQLVCLDSNGIIATHDLELGKLEAEFPGQVKNYCFEAEIKDNSLTFSYKMREGVAQNMNASFLMKQMGIAGL